MDCWLRRTWPPWCHWVGLRTAHMRPWRRQRTRETTTTSTTKTHIDSVGKYYNTHTHPFLNCKFAIHIYILHQGDISVLTNFMEGELIIFLFELCFFFLQTRTNFDHVLVWFYFQTTQEKSFIYIIDTCPTISFLENKQTSLSYLYNPTFFCRSEAHNRAKTRSWSWIVLEVQCTHKKK